MERIIQANVYEKYVLRQSTTIAKVNRKQKTNKNGVRT